MSAPGRLGNFHLVLEEYYTETFEFYTQDVRDQLRKIAAAHNLSSGDLTLCCQLYTGINLQESKTVSLSHEDLSGLEKEIHEFIKRGGVISSLPEKEE